MLSFVSSQVNARPADCQQPSDGTHYGHHIQWSELVTQVATTRPPNDGRRICGDEGVERFIGTDSNLRSVSPVNAVGLNGKLTSLGVDIEETQGNILELV